MISGIVLVVIAAIVAFIYELSRRQVPYISLGLTILTLLLYSVGLGKFPLR